MESTTTPGFNQSPSTGFSSRSDRTSDARQGRGSQRWLDKFDTILNESSDQDIETLKARLREQLATARGALNDAAGTAAGAANSYVRDAIECTEQYVETRPWQAISYVAGAAFLLGIIVGRR